VKQAIFGETSARMYNYQRRADLPGDKVSQAKAQYAASGEGRSNLAYGYVMREPGGETIVS
jgi:hypothetical protein